MWMFAVLVFAVRYIKSRKAVILEKIVRHRNQIGGVVPYQQVFGLKPFSVKPPGSP